MKRIITSLLLLTSALALSACSTGTPFGCACHSYQNCHATKNMPLSGINQINITGPITTNIRLDQKKSALFLKGQDIPVSATCITQKIGTLSIIGTDPNAKLTITLPSLQTLTLDHTQNVTVIAKKEKTLNLNAHDAQKVLFIGHYHLPSLTITGSQNSAILAKQPKSLDVDLIKITSSGHVILKDIKSQGSHITLDSDGSLTLQGYIHPKDIYKAGNGILNLRWIDANRLNLNIVDDGIVKLAGKVKNLHVIMNDHSQLKARFLRAKAIDIRTYHHAFATIHPLRKLFAHAQDQSKIDYYGKPKELYKKPLDKALILPLSK